MRLHLGCGDVYLDGYVNADLEIPGYSFPAILHPELVAQNRTTLAHYYRHTYTTAGPVDRLCVCDAFMDARKTGLAEQSVDEIVAVQLLEHFTPAEAQQALREWRRVLAPGCSLFVDTIDFPGVVDCLRAAESDVEEAYWYRMVYGSWKNAAACHKDGYSRRKLTDLLLGSGFTCLAQLPNPLRHPYPSLTFRAMRP